ncbi:hypothetical protein LTS18_005312 [Coniosporium uncinatum]|uniref:Uncharacterized protein n=1 Tax=Coniosporium uncinatum TaxID=93489 RepID=A0ACC3DRM2_9PEZI|nr:hypothetical protein LTS18_005312 [Coniosporium uncinatum]
MEISKEVEIRMTDPDELPRWSDAQTSALKPSEVAPEDSGQALRPHGNPCLRFLGEGAPRSRRKQCGSASISKPLKEEEGGFMSRPWDVDDICEVFVKCESKPVMKKVSRTQAYTPKRNGVGQMTKRILRQQRRVAMEEESEVPLPASRQTEQPPLPSFIASEAESDEQPQHPSTTPQATRTQLPPFPGQIILDSRYTALKLAHDLEDHPPPETFMLWTDGSCLSEEPHGQTAASTVYRVPCLIGRQVLGPWKGMSRVLGKWADGYTSLDAEVFALKLALDVALILTGPEAETHFAEAVADGSFPAQLNPSSPDTLRPQDTTANQTSLTSPFHPSNYLNLRSQLSATSTITTVVVMFDCRDALRFVQCPSYGFESHRRHFIVSSTVEEINVQAQVLRNRGLRLELRLVPGHKGVDGNARAKTLARKTAWAATLKERVQE